MRHESSSIVAHITLDFLEMTSVQLLSMMLGVKNSGVSVDLIVPTSNSQRRQLLYLLANPDYAAVAQVQLSSEQWTSAMVSGQKPEPYPAQHVPR